MCLFCQQNFIVTFSLSLYCHGIMGSCSSLSLFWQQNLIVYLSLSSLCYQSLHSFSVCLPFIGKTLWFVSLHLSFVMVSWDYVNINHSFIIKIEVDTVFFFILSTKHYGLFVFYYLVMISLDHVCHCHCLVFLCWNSWIIFINVWQQKAPIKWTPFLSLLLLKGKWTFCWG